MPSLEFMVAPGGAPPWPAPVSRTSQASCSCSYSCFFSCSFTVSESQDPHTCGNIVPGLGARSLLHILSLLTLPGPHQHHHPTQRSPTQTKTRMVHHQPPRLAQRPPPSSPGVCASSPPSCAPPHLRRATAGQSALPR